MKTSEEILELAVHSQDRNEFRNGVLDLLQRRVGFDAANIMSTDLSGRISVVERGYHCAEYLTQIHAYMNELKADELRVLSAGSRCVMASEWLGLARRDELRLYREVMTPLGLREDGGYMWSNRYGAFGLNIARSGNAARFSDRERAILNRVRVPLQFGETAFARAGECSHLQLCSAWASSYGLSVRERAVTELAMRGLRNKEIARVLGISASTTRNYLSSIFRKAGVSTRAELVFFATHELVSERAQAPAPAWLTRILRDGPLVREESRAEGACDDAAVSGNDAC